MPFLATLVFISNALAISYRPYREDEMIERSELVAEGEVMTVFALPPGPAAEHHMAVAKVKLGTVFKGPAKAGDEIMLAYWSAGPADWTRPDSYAVGEKLMLALRRRSPEDLRNHRGPPEAAQAGWFNPFRLPVYNSKIQAPIFRKWLSTREDPQASFTDPDPETRATALWWAVRSTTGKPSPQLISAVLAGLKNPKDTIGLKSASEAASILRLREAVEPCLKVLENDGDFAVDSALTSIADVPPILQFIETCPETRPRRRAVALLSGILSKAREANTPADARIRPFLMKLLEDKNPDVVSSTCQVLWYETLTGEELELIAKLEEKAPSESSVKESLLSLLKKNRPNP